MATFHLSIITANGKAFDGNAESLILPGIGGEFGILANHTPLISALKQGLAKLIQEDGVEKHFIIGDGYVEVAMNEVSVLTVKAAELKDRSTGLELLAQPKPWEALEALNNS